MFAYQYDFDGWLVGPVECDPHPLRPGQFIVPGSATLGMPPNVPAGKRARFVNGAWTLVKAPPGVQAPPPLTAEEILAAERESWAPYARAFFASLAFFPAPGFLHMLDQYTQAVAATRTANPYDPLVLWDQRVTIVLCAHPDMEVFRVAFGLDPLLLDLIFRAALLLEAEEDPVIVAGFVATGLAGLAP